MPRQQARQQQVARPAEVFCQSCLPVEHGVAELVSAAEYADDFRHDASLWNEPGLRCVDFQRRHGGENSGERGSPLKLAVVVMDWFPAQTAMVVPLADIPLRAPSWENWR